MTKKYISWDDTANVLPSVVVNYLKGLFAPKTGIPPASIAGTAVVTSDARLARTVQYAQQAANGTWPARPTSSATALVLWRGIAGGSAPPEVTSGTGGMLTGVDVWVRVRVP